MKNKKCISIESRCPVCFGEDVCLWHYYKKINHSIVECKLCKVKFRRNKNTKLKKAQLFYNSKRYQELRKNVEWRSLLVAKLRMEQLLEPGLVDKDMCILEIGSNSGEFLHIANDAGFNAFGIEPSGGLVDYAKGRYGLKNIKIGFFPGVTYEGMFDIIVLFHVFEHIEKPYEFIKNIKKQLKPNGVLYLRIPNGSGFYLNFFSYRHPNYRQPDHYFYYSKEHLKKILFSEGFEIKFLFTYEDSNNLFTVLYYMLMPRLKRLFKKPFMRRLNWLEKYLSPNLAYWMGKHTSWLQHFWIKYLCRIMRGGELVVIARLMG